MLAMGRMLEREKRIPGVLLKRPFKWHDPFQDSLRIGGFYAEAEGDGLWHV